jgi:hypothetical protein
MQGQNDLTEMYSAIEAEVPIESDPLTQPNFEFVEDLKRADKVSFFGGRGKGGGGCFCVVRRRLSTIFVCIV